MQPQSYLDSSTACCWSAATRAGARGEGGAPATITLAPKDTAKPDEVITPNTEETIPKPDALPPVLPEVPTSEEGPLQPAAFDGREDDASMVRFN